MLQIKQRGLLEAYTLGPTQWGGPKTRQHQSIHLTGQRTDQRTWAEGTSRLYVRGGVLFRINESCILASLSRMSD